jgi:hypothetical protein
MNPTKLSWWNAVREEWHFWRMRRASARNARTTARYHARKCREINPGLYGPPTTINAPKP